MAHNRNLSGLSDSEDEDVILAGGDAAIDEHSPNDADLQHKGTVEHASLLVYKEHHILEVINILQVSGIPSFIAGSQALRFYGCRLIQSFCTIAVPSDLHEQAIKILSEQPILRRDLRFSPWSISGPSLRFPCFDREGTTLKILLVPDRAWGLQCLPTHITCDPRSGLPYPTLPHFAQSFLKTKDVNNLELLVDGQDLALDWGYENLDLGRHSWKKVVWKRTVEEKEKRIPLEKPKYLYATRFRRRKPEIPK